MEATLEARSCTSSCALFGLPSSVGVPAPRALVTELVSQSAKLCCKGLGLVIRNTLCGLDWVLACASGWAFAVLGRMRLVPAYCACMAEDTGSKRAACGAGVAHADAAHQRVRGRGAGDCIAYHIRAPA